MSPQRRLDAAAMAATVLIAIGYVAGVLWRRAVPGPALISYDIYGAHYPNVIYLLRALKEGHGLLWNRLQNCGEPFIPSTLLGMFYPLHLIFLLVETNTAFIVLAAVHLAIGGAGAYLLARQLGVGAVAALCGALTFELGGTAIGLATWLPSSILGIYVWIPWALLLCERILRAPAVATGFALGVVLTLELLPGYPQILFFTYQFIALRVVWELLTLKMPEMRRSLAVLALGLVFPAFLGAVQLLPMAEFARESIRSSPLTQGEMKPGGSLTWHDFRAQTALRRTAAAGGIFTVVTLALAAESLMARARRRLASFYVLAGGLYVVLAFENPLSALYRALPSSTLFREPFRGMWMTSFALSMAVAFGTEAVTGAAAITGRLRGLAVLAPAAGAVVFAYIAKLSLQLWEGFLLATLLLCCAARFLAGRAGIGRVAIPVVLLVNLLVVGARPFLLYLSNDALLYRNRAAFEFVKKRMTLQDRIYQCAKHADYAFMPKSAQIFGTPSIIDHEPQTAKRYAEVIIWLMFNHPMQSLNEFLYAAIWEPVPHNRPLLNLLATRYLLVDPSWSVDAVTPPPLELLSVVNGLQVYENPSAQPRAFYVPQTRVVENPDELLSQLGSADNTPRLVALLSELPADGFVGNPGGQGEATIIEDRSETVTLRVRATQDGFVYLGDQYYPGWEATVNGKPAPILRANFDFRLIRVPAGESTVVFHYSPVSVWLGGAVSLLTAFGVAVWFVFWRKNPQPRAP